MYKEEKHICLITIYQFNYIDLNMWVLFFPPEQGLNTFFWKGKGRRLEGMITGKRSSSLKL